MVMSECETTELIKMINTKKEKSQHLLKKRINQWSHEMRKSYTNSPERIIPHFYGDRFIPRRYAFKQKDTNEIFLYTGKQEDLLSMRFAPSYLRYKELKMVLNSSFGIKPKRVLECSDVAQKKELLSSCGVLPSIPTFEFTYEKLNGFDWPCAPRSRPLACADTTHDIPYFDMFSDLNLIDWSVDGQIAASFGRDLVLWNLSCDLTLVYKIRNSRSIAYCPKGRFLGIGSKNYEWPVFELWDLKNPKRLCINNVYYFSKTDCIVVCIEWAQNGKIVVCGTTLGWVYVFSAPKLNVIRVLKNHKQSVYMVKFSPTMRFLAISDIEGRIYVYNWPSFEVHVVLRSKRKLRVVLDWHPWNGTDLAISEESPASIVILHVPSKEIVAYYQRRDKKVEIDYITFNKLTAELLVSCSSKDDDGCIKSEILVMSSLNRVVDVLSVPDNCVRFMMWSPNGMQLATAGNDETLTIWNYLPNRDKNLNSKPVIDKMRKLNLVKANNSKCTFDLKFGSEFKKWVQIR